MITGTSSVQNLPSCHFLLIAIPCKISFSIVQLLHPRAFCLNPSVTNENSCFTATNGLDSKYIAKYFISLYLQDLDHYHLLGQELQQ